MRDGSSAPLAAQRTPPQPCHLGRQAGLVDEDQFRRIEVGLFIEPGLAAYQDVRALLLGGVRSLFLCVNPQRRSHMHSIARLMRTLCSA